MNLSKSILLLFLFASLKACKNGNIDLSVNKDRANVVFIIVDDLGWSDLGCYGSSFYETPNIDELAEEGVRFTRGYASSPVCSPTRSSILTGKNPARTHNTAYFGDLQPNDITEGYTKPLIPPKYQDYLGPDEKTLAEALKDNGYHTFFAGKWHLGPEGFWPEDNGFDENKGGWTNGGPYGGDKYFSPYGNPNLKDGPDGEHLPDRLANETVDFIRKNKDNPFFAYLSFYSVHTPLMGRPDLVEKYNYKKSLLLSKDSIYGTEGANKVRMVQNHPVYASMVEAMDQAVGKVLSALKRYGLDKNTAVFLTSDNGGLSTSEGLPTSNRPLRAGKGWLYEGGIRVPMVMRWNETILGNGVCKIPVTTTDFYPTILEITQSKLLPNQHKDGKSFLELVQNKRKESWDRTIYFHYPHYGNQGGSPGSAIIQNNWKLILWYEKDQIELYNLENDIGEETNLSLVYPDKANDMLLALRSYLNDVEARFPIKVKQSKP
ncbi:sulfatase [Arenibacter sp. M-2]|uniref:sulfatase n=1 Tax=Arenibacter sp. M-2 TaxID=3053612 RepID=UPI002570FC1C|nr:sulfatase [Arenibacter sp. M-2]MDL5512287.1 sulfatase [Arenibacter sp. M-2]